MRMIPPVRPSPPPFSSPQAAIPREATTRIRVGKPTFSKLLSAAGFQLKGSGWYATDFKSKAKPAEKPAETKTETKTETKPESKPETKSETPA